MKKVNVAIIGAGSAGLSALRQVKEQTDNYIMIDQTPLGTKCARTGCMPSKALIIAAMDYNRRRVFEQKGIAGAESLHIRIPAVLRHVRQMRDRFSEGMAKTTKRLAGDRLITGKARIISPDCIRVNQTEIRTERIIIATGSAPLVPDSWKPLGSRLLTSDTIFEQENLPGRIAVIGLGPIGLELGQALRRLGLDITAFDMKPSIAAITDPAINSSALQIFKEEFPIYLNAAAQIEEETARLRITHPDKTVTADSVLVAVGVVPQVTDLGLENLGVELNAEGLPPFDGQSLQVADLPVFIAGDVNGCRPILHEALDEGFIAGRNSVTDKISCYCRRTAMQLVFSDPQIAAVGLNHQQLTNEKQPFIIGAADFREQSRALLEQRNAGLLHVYADPASAQILGAELACPDAEHLAHLLAAAVQHQLTVFDMLQLPFYHPTVTEGLRTALRDAARQLSGRISPAGLSLCDSCPEPPLR